MTYQKKNTNNNLKGDELDKYFSMRQNEGKVVIEIRELRVVLQLMPNLRFFRSRNR